MKITRKIEVSEEEFYNHLERELLSAIHKYSNVELNAKEIKKGLKYINNDNSRAEVYILDYKRGSLYKAKIKSVSETITISYQTEVEKDGLKVTFIQDIEGFNEKKQNKLMKMFSEGVYLGRMCDTIYKFRTDIQKQREHKNV